MVRALQCEATNAVAGMENQSRSAVEPFRSGGAADATSLCERHRRKGVSAEEKVSGTISLTKGVGNHFVGWGGRAAAGLSRGQIVAPCPPDRHRWRTTGRTGRRRATKRLLIPFPPVTGSLGQLPLEMRDDDLGENLLSPKPVVLEVQAVNITDLAIDDPTLDKIINGLPELLVDQEIGDQAP
jgi:hypothetical protein